DSQNRNANFSTYWQQRKKTTYRHRRANENRRSKNESREKNNEHMRKHGFERGFIDCRTLKEQGIERRPEVHLGFEAAGRLD
ncbi:MobA/MobL family protein, partial [Escherichia coli]|uniref:MobA/MobL family protein n=1 Tax=Escherichia coli TaxID=562 RepID=UPI003EE242A0